MTRVAEEWAAKVELYDAIWEMDAARMVEYEEDYERESKRRYNSNPVEWLFWHNRYFEARIASGASRIMLLNASDVVSAAKRGDAVEVARCVKVAEKYEAMVERKKMERQAAADRALEEAEAEMAERAMADARIEEAPAHADEAPAHAEEAPAHAEEAPADMEEPMLPESEATKKLKDVLRTIESTLSEAADAGEVSQGVYLRVADLLKEAYDVNNQDVLSAHLVRMFEQGDFHYDRHPSNRGDGPADIVAMFG